jgi:glycosidase
LIFNGNEIADNSLNTFFAPVEDIARARKTVDWGRALQPAGQKRLALIRALAKMRHEQPVFANGSQEWVTDGEEQGVVSFVRRAGGKAVFVSANLTDKAASFSVKGLSPHADKPLLAENGNVSTDGAVRLGPWGFVVVDVK